MSADHGAEGPGRPLVPPGAPLTGEGRPGNMAPGKPTRARRNPTMSRPHGESEPSDIPNLPRMVSLGGLYARELADSPTQRSANSHMLPALNPVLTARRR